MPPRGAKRLVGADGAAYIAKVVAERCPNATVCADPFHVVSWATKALDEVRREVWNQARHQGGDKAGAKALQRCRYALWKNQGPSAHPHGLRLPLPEALVALALLDRGGYCPPLPGRG